MSVLKFGSLFTGLGGFDLGFERAGLRCAWQVELNPHCWKVLHRHWPNVPKWDDARTFPPDFSNYWGMVDVIIGGDPCQANSAAVGGGQSEYESLGGEFLRIVNVLRPRIVVRENPSLIRRNAPWPWWRFRAGLESLGYAVLPFRLRACCTGAIHQRERMFLLAEMANPNGKRLEGRQENNETRHGEKPARSMDAKVWESLYASRGFGSRAGLPDYVERIRGLGNAVNVQAAEFVGRQILRSLADDRN